MTIQIILLVLICTVSTAILGFLGGVIFEKWWTAGALERATQKVSKAAEHLIKSLEQTHVIANRLSSIPGQKLDPSHFQDICRLHTGLNSVLDTLIETFSSSVDHESNPNKPVIPTRIEWVKSPLDFRTDLPDYSAAMQNLGLLSTHLKRLGTGSILLVKLDKFDDLGRRYGEQERNNLLKNLSQLVVRHMRHMDLLCHLYDDLYIVLMPGITDDQIASSIRNTIKSHRFYLEKNHQEVIVSASLGLYTLLQGDTAQLALERARTALSESSKKGRNLLVMHTGQGTQLCRAS